MELPGGAYASIGNYGYGYNGMEKDDELKGSGKLYSTLFREGDTENGRWWSRDPKEMSMPYQSPYVLMDANPIRYTDPNGDTVLSVFNRSKKTLRIIDMDHYEKGLPYKVVNADEYKFGGIRDEDGNLTHNQVLLVKNVFTGGRSDNGVVTRDPDSRMQRAIPKGKYSILDNNADTRHTGWFRLDTQDESPYNDKHDATGRDGFRFHLGGLSFGCVTCDATIKDRSKEWTIITKIMENTSTTNVPEKRGYQWLNPFSTLINFGTMKVIGEDKIPTKPKEP